MEEHNKIKKFKETINIYLNISFLWISICFSLLILNSLFGIKEDYIYFSIGLFYGIISIVILFVIEFIFLKLNQKKEVLNDKRR